MPQIYENLFQNWIDDLPIKWGGVLDKVRRPNQYDSKDKIPLWSFYALKPETTDLWCGPQAIGANMKSITALLIDYDGGIFTMEDAKREFGFQFVAYSSPSSRADHPKFRMIVPLAEPVSNKYFKVKKIRELLCRKFAGCDNSTFDYFRRQRMPAVLPDTDYSYHEQEGDRLSLDQVYYEAMYQEWVRESTRKMEAPLSKKSIFGQSKAELETLNMVGNMKNRYASELKRLKIFERGNGVVHDTFRKVAYALRKSGVPQDEIVEFFATNLPGQRQHNVTKEIEDLIYGDIHE